MIAKLHISLLSIFFFLNLSNLNAATNSQYYERIIQRSSKIINSNAAFKSTDISTKLDSLSNPHHSDKNSILATKIVYDICETLFQHGKYIDCIHYASYCRPLLRKVIAQNKELQSVYVNILNQYGMSYNMIGLQEQAYGIFKEALKIAEQYQLDSDQAVLYNNIAGIYMNRKSYKEAESIYSKATKINEQLKDKAKLFVNYNNLSANAAKQKNYNRALEYAFLSIHQLDAEKDSDMIMLVQRNIASIYLNNNEKSLALKNLREVCEYQEKKQQMGFLPDTYRIMAEIKAGTDSSIIYLNKALSIAESQGNLADIAVLYSKSAEYHMRHKNHEKANEYLRKLASANDSISKTERKIHAENFSDIFEEEELQSEEMDKLRNERDNATRNTTVVIIAALLAISMATVFLFLHNRSRKKQRLRKIRTILRRRNTESNTQSAEIKALSEQLKKSGMDLELNENKRTIMSLQAIRHHEFMQILTEDLKHLILKINPRDTATRKLLRNTLLQIERSESLNTQKEFINSFENINSSFYKALTDKYPTLTQKELRMCAFIRLGLSSKEIADITFREVRSVEAVRIRLRKKFDLSPDEDLSRFLYKLNNM